MVADDAGQFGLLPDYPKEVFYDLNALDAKRVEVLLSVDGRLTKWLFDGDSWQHVRNYSLQVAGPFLVANGGRSIVSARDGAWSVISDIENANPEVLAIVDRVEGEPLTLVEDKVGHSHFFLHRDKLLDDTGRELFTARAPRDRADRLRQVIDFVVSRRQRP